MSKILDYLKRPIGIGIASFVIGLLIGWMFLGWLVWPVQWKNASPADLQPDYKKIYLEMAIEAYALTGKAEDASIRWMGLKDRR